MPERGDVEPVSKWIRVNGGSFPKNGSVTFDSTGHNIDPKKVKCQSVTYAVVRRYREAKRCPNKFAFQRLRWFTMIRAFFLAKSLAKGCRKNGCIPKISFQYENSNCNPSFEPGQKPFMETGFVFRVDCIEP